MTFQKLIYSLVVFPYVSKMHNLHLCLTEGTLLVHSLLYWNFRKIDSLPFPTRTTIAFVIIGTVVFLAFINLVLVLSVAYTKCKQRRAASSARVEAVDTIRRNPSDVILSFEALEKQPTEELKNEKWIESADSQSHPAKPVVNVNNSHEHLTESALLNTGRTQVPLREEMKKTEDATEKIWKQILDSKRKGLSFKEQSSVSS